MSRITISPLDFKLNSAVPIGRIQQMADCKVKSGRWEVPR